ncbi:UDP-N-acetylmuramate--L-alanine ligase [Orenia metallireducens]|jgi:UDP-N-acetylmuramate--alanine ligase|uniref:UDP-N-acetylmuramate--L-alanine ligase n=1 Tax=Orenia metallireducens TaxID=1413210 RepID=A0A1C0A8C8_9FIRM|nr:UDP-N-acetylmuramate--L-alanine ligase [Orenia metallireducens]OCL26505.1 UDP-N-acetylmuramate--L-alanine ligase [Orenia metallireducens]
MKRAHIIGIGGIAMSAIAQCLIQLGYKVTGSDLHHNDLVEELRNQGVEITIGHQAENISTKIEKVICSDAIPETNVEIVKAKEYGLDLLGRSDALAWITKEKRVISASGTHGKTTTSSMIAYLLEEGKKEPSFIIGGILNNFGSNFRANQGDYFVLEGDEYNKSFLKYPSDIGVITNIEFDHPDIYADMAEVFDTYHQYVDGLRECLVTNQQVIEQLGLKIEEMSIEVVTVGIDDNQAEFNAINIREEELSSYFNVEYQGEEIGEFKINALGSYNVKHALEAMAVAKYCGLSFEAIKRGLRLWQGVKRRFEILDDDESRIVISDYAHHPSEVEAVAEILERIKSNKKKVLIFQPHQYIRTKSLFEDYKGILDKEIDEKVILKIYKVREAVENEDLEKLGNKLSQMVSKGDTAYYNRFEDLKRWLDQYKQDNQAIYLFLGAGDIDTFAREWAQRD